MNKYVYAEATQDYWPQIKTVVAQSYNEAVDKVIEKYSDKFSDDDDFSVIEDWDDLRDELNSKFGFDLSDLEDVEEL